MAVSLYDKAKKILKALFRRRPEPETPGDPFAYVTTPKKPRPYSGSAAAVADLEE